METIPEIGEESCSFFEHGQISIDFRNYVSREAVIGITAPYSLIQTITPILLGTGILDQFQLHTPISVWIPKLVKESLSELCQKLNPGEVEKSINEQNVNYAKAVCDYFVRASQYVKNPADLAFILPLGVYVDVKLRCQVDKLLGCITEFEKINLVGVREIQWALSSIFARILWEIDSCQKPTLLGIR